MDATLDFVRSDRSNELWIRIEAFLSTRAENTQITYRGILSEWCEFLGAKAGTAEAAKRIKSVTDLHAAAYGKWLQNRPGQKPRMKDGAPSRSRAVHTQVKKSQKKTGLQLSQTNATIWKKFAALRRMYRVLIASGLGPSYNPFDVDRVPPPPKESGRKRPTEMISYKLVQEIIQLPDISQPKGQRDRGILAALFGGGLRRSEVAELRIGDARKTKNGTAFLYLRSTKAKKDAEQALPDWAAKEIFKVVEQRKRQGASDGEYLFVSYRGRAGVTPTDNPISHAGIYHLFKQYCMMSGAGTFVSPHSARATAITRLLDEGLSHRVVKDFSRHASVQMVEVYDKRRSSVDENPAKKLKY